MSTLTPLTTTQLVLVPATTTPGVLSVTSLTSTTVTFTGLMSRDDFSPLTFGDSGKFLSLRRHITSPGSSQSIAEIAMQSHGTRQNSYSKALILTVEDDSSVATAAPAVTGAANNGSGLIRITAAGHGFATGDVIAVYGVGGVTAANGSWTITVISSSVFDLQGSVFAGAYTTGGHVTNRSSMFGAIAVVVPKQTRGGLTGTAVAGDDLGAWGAYNGTANNSTAGAAYLVNRGTADAGIDEWSSGFATEANVTTGISLGGVCSQFGIDFTAQGSGASSYGIGTMKFPNMVSVWADNAAGSGLIQLFRCDTLDEFQVLAAARHSAATTFDGAVSFGNATFFLADGVRMATGTTTGLVIGAATNQKLGFYAVTPVVQPATTGTATGFTAGAGTAVKDDSTFTGAVGSTAYRISDIVKHLKNLGLIAQ